MSGYHLLLSETDYCSNQVDLGVSFVAVALSSKPFEKIKSILHHVDNQSLTTVGIKMTKVLPPYNAVNEALVQFVLLHLYPSIDKSMVPYFGLQSCKMFIHGKPSR